MCLFQLCLTLKDTTENYSDTFLEVWERLANLIFTVASLIESQPLCVPILYADLDPIHQKFIQENPFAYSMILVGHLRRTMPNVYRLRLRI